jgi:catechol 2,3-dioxygenase-like lactoylglutathione lyase family enzyme
MMQAALPTCIGAGERDCLMRSQNTYLRLLESSEFSVAVQGQQKMRPVSDAGIVHICLQSPSIETLYSSFARSGADFHAEPVDLGTGFLYSYARDLEKNVVELEGVPPVWKDKTPWVAHVSFSTADIDRLVGFYASVLGQVPIRSATLGPNRRIDAVSGLKDTQFMAAWIPAGNMQIEIIQYLQPKTLAHAGARMLAELGYAYVCFEVADIELASTRFLAAGASRLSDFAHIDGPSCFFCADPDGNPILLVAPGADSKHLSISALPNADIVSRMAIRRAELHQSAVNKT